MECKVLVGLDEKMIWSRRFLVPRKESKFYLIGHGEQLKDGKYQSQFHSNISQQYINLKNEHIAMVTSQIVHI